ncbi:hypothetical protein NVP1121O_081 [Vibrio phage 1.121.O._10N.286.46.C4]|nr:hypothetical protein NVP1121O_081 [Vibrio phage 1.121.O._10N.286.46.C4]
MKSSQYEVVSKSGIAWFWEPRDNTPVKVKIIDSDFDKRVTAVNLSTGEEFMYKWGYFFNTQLDCQETIDGKYVASISPWKILLSNRDYSLWSKRVRKERSTRGYYIFIEQYKYHFKYLKDALNSFKVLDEGVVKDACLGSNKYGHLLSLEDGQLFEWEIRRKRSLLKSRHTCKVSGYRELHK